MTNWVAFDVAAANVAWSLYVMIVANANWGTKQAMKPANTMERI